MVDQVLFQNRKPDRVATLEEYRASGGYVALARVLRENAPREVPKIIDASGLRGRGGAGFPCAKKWMAVPEHGAFPRYVAVNSDEMEPGTFKDRVLIHADPHAILEGLCIAAFAISAEKGYIFVRPSYENAARILEQEVERARNAGFLGKNILDSGFSFDVIVHRSGGRYICGEASALLKALMGKRPNPAKAPPFPTDKGLWERPTLVNNVETLANVPHIIRNGPGWFKGLARTPTGSGTKLYCVSGRVSRPGCFELPMGTPLSEIIEQHAGGLPEGRRFKACLPGGASTRFMTAEHYDIEMDFDSLAAVGHRLGTAAIMVFDDRTCLVGVTLNLIDFFARESCGWCTPCREGIPYIRDLLWRIEHGEGLEEHIPQLREMSRHLWNAYCAFAPGAASPVESLLTFFEDEVREHISQKKCPFGGR
jgi:NADH-quinone oxidoreductase subunit F